MKAATPLWAGVLRMACIAVALAGTAQASSDDPDFQVCRRVHGKKECVGFDSGCSRTFWERTLENPALKSCREVGPKVCKGMEKILSGLFENLRKRPETERHLDLIGGSTCDGLSLSVPNHTVTACIEDHAEAANALLRALNLLRIQCH